jgi:hypothetical protein
MGPFGGRGIEMRSADDELIHVALQFLQRQRGSAQGFSGIVLVPLNSDAEPQFLEEPASQRVEGVFAELDFRGGIVIVQ